VNCYDNSPNKKFKKYITIEIGDVASEIMKKEKTMSSIQTFFNAQPSHGMPSLHSS
jgi:hypothetical protein